MCCAPLALPAAAAPAGPPGTAKSRGRPALLASTLPRWRALPQAAGTAAIPRNRRTAQSARPAPVPGQRTPPGTGPPDPAPAPRPTSRPAWPTAPRPAACAHRRPAAAATPAAAAARPGRAAARPLLDELVSRGLPPSRLQPGKVNQLKRHRVGRADDLRRLAVSQGHEPGPQHLMPRGQPVDGPPDGAVVRGPDSRTTSGTPCAGWQAPRPAAHSCSCPQHSGRYARPGGRRGI